VLQNSSFNLQNKSTRAPILYQSNKTNSYDFTTPAIALDRLRLRAQVHVHPAVHMIFHRMSWPDPGPAPRVSLARCMPRYCSLRRIMRTTHAKKPTEHRSIRSLNSWISSPGDNATSSPRQRFLKQVYVLVCADMPMVTTDQGDNFLCVLDFSSCLHSLKVTNLSKLSVLTVMSI
jgi:hypothetical protein